MSDSWVARRSWTIRGERYNGYNVQQVANRDFLLLHRPSLIENVTPGSVKKSRELRIAGEADCNVSASNDSRTNFSIERDTNVCLSSEISARLKLEMSFDQGSFKSCQGVIAYPPWQLKRWKGREM